ncbi:MAG: OmpA family protein [Bryobacteraceae bacterium]|nr:OmpA family protein [Bryobacteraceae bacterium]
MLSKFGAYGSLLGLLFLVWNCVSSHSGIIASTVKASTEASLQAAPVAGVKVGVDGREVVLTGLVPTEEAKTKAGIAALATPGVRTVDNQLLVGVEAHVLQPVLTKILLEKKIEFETGKNVLLPSSTPVLDEVLKVLNQAPNLAINIAGHTDNVGLPDANRTLSAARAEAVVDWLSGHGIAKDRMSASGFGPDKPIANNATPEGRGQNRRVEITVK